MVCASWFIWQVQKRIQTTDPSLADLQEDTGFCLYPGDSRGSGLDFSAFHGGEEHAGQSHSARSASTSRYAFKPLDAPNGSVTVRLEYRRGVDSKVCMLLCVSVIGGGLPVPMKGSSNPFPLLRVHTHEFVAFLLRVTSKLQNFTSLERFPDSELCFYLCQLVDGFEVTK